MKSFIAAFLALGAIGIEQMKRALPSPTTRSAPREQISVWGLSQVGKADARRYRRNQKRLQNWTGATTF